MITNQNGIVNLCHAKQLPFIMISRKLFVGFLFLRSLPSVHWFFCSDEDDEEYYMSMLIQEVEVETLYISRLFHLGQAYYTFRRYKNPGTNPMSGSLGYRLNGFRFVGKELYRLNFFFMYGTLQGHDFNISRAMQQDVSKLKVDDDSDPIITIRLLKPSLFWGSVAGIWIRHWLGYQTLQTLLSLGVSSFTFSPKGNIYYGDEADKNYYFSGSDGTIRNSRNRPKPLGYFLLRNFDDN